ncbi:hypothetical protein [Veronia pacifica]|uniref:Uncharacterized protein n=1 Tax=Veronia pacifica TaxID=1080227 RepID=A0A1C3EPC8_9GAMM|nr:hypothetical protein [Veronia pacifica]ODA35049.1 hypothetical protein A8L45_05055 [Veronia pacifica]
MSDLTAISSKRLDAANNITNDDKNVKDENQEDRDQQARDQVKDKRGKPRTNEGARLSGDEVQRRAQAQVNKDSNSEAKKPTEQSTPPATSLPNDKSQREQSQLPRQGKSLSTQPSQQEVNEYVSKHYTKQEEKYLRENYENAKKSNPNLSLGDYVQSTNVDGKGNPVPIFGNSGKSQAKRSADNQTTTGNSTVAEYNPSAAQQKSDEKAATSTFLGVMKKANELASKGSLITEENVEKLGNAFKDYASNNKEFLRNLVKNTKEGEAVPLKTEWLSGNPTLLAIAQYGTQSSYGTGNSVISGVGGKGPSVQLLAYLNPETGGFGFQVAQHTEVSWDYGNSRLSSDAVNALTQGIIAPSLGAGGQLITNRGIQWDFNWQNGEPKMDGGSVYDETILRPVEATFKAFPGAPTHQGTVGLEFGMVNKDKFDSEYNGLDWEDVNKRAVANGYETLAGAGGFAVVAAAKAMSAYSQGDSTGRALAGIAAAAATGYRVGQQLYGTGDTIYNFASGSADSSHAWGHVTFGGADFNANPAPVRNAINTIRDQIRSQGVTSSDIDIEAGSNNIELSILGSSEDRPYVPLDEDQIPQIPYVPQGADQIPYIDDDPIEEPIGAPVPGAIQPPTPAEGSRPQTPQDPASQVPRPPTPVDSGSVGPESQIPSPDTNNNAVAKEFAAIYPRLNINWFSHDRINVPTSVDGKPVDLPDGRKLDGLKPDYPDFAERYEKSSWSALANLGQKLGARKQAIRYSDGSILTGGPSNAPGYDNYGRLELIDGDTGQTLWSYDSGQARAKQIQNSPNFSPTTPHQQWSQQQIEDGEPLRWAQQHFTSINGVEKYAGIHSLDAFRKNVDNFNYYNDWGDWGPGWSSAQNYLKGEYFAFQDGYAVAMPGSTTGSWHWYAYTREGQLAWQRDLPNYKN